MMEWRTGDVSGTLPYSRMTVAPGDSFAARQTEVLSVHKRYFPELTRECPLFTALTVHVMLDRARDFNTSDLQDEKMMSLGKLAAGLAHELNNPASATVRSAKLLHVSMAEIDDAARAVASAGLSPDALAAIEVVRAACMAEPISDMRSPLERAEREDEIADWLMGHGLDPQHAGSLADTVMSIEALDSLAAVTQGEALDASIRWIASSAATSALASDIERAATRIYELVYAVKRFTYMDNLAGPEQVDIAAGLRDTIKVLASKAKLKNAAVTLEVEPGLPRATAHGGELNQVWMNLIDNALDAIPDGGNIDVLVRPEMDRIVVEVVDDGPGIPPDVISRIFDPFFTTKPQGEGTGLGLDMAQRFVRRSQGDISVESRPGRTVFRVSLRAEEPAPQAIGVDVGST